VNLVRAKKIWHRWPVLGIDTAVPCPLEDFLVNIRPLERIQKDKRILVLICLLS